MQEMLCFINGSTIPNISAPWMYIDVLWQPFFPLFVHLKYFATTGLLIVKEVICLDIRIVLFLWDSITVQFMLLLEIDKSQDNKEQLIPDVDINE